jgi:hypothetical protein
MNREEAKIILPFVTALAECKTVQYCDDYEKDIWRDLENVNIPAILNRPEYYRIKPEPTYLPFRDGAECWEAVQKHDPFGWVKLKIDPLNMTIGIAEVNKCNVFLSGSRFEAPFDYKEAFEKLIFADGEPFGMKEE